PGGGRLADVRPAPRAGEGNGANRMRNMGELGVMGGLGEMKSMGAMGVMGNMGAMGMMKSMGDGMPMGFKYSLMVQY
ncbi:MAG: hypothetical protein J6K19_04925, partial [Prevotella sp.]|nr:hypothetical protein [Prevotella sp.]